MELEYVACNLCDGEETLHLFSSPERRFGLSGRFDVVQCRGCGLVYLNPRPTAREMQRYYPADRYFPYRKIVRRDGFAQSVRLGLKRMVLAEHRGYPRRRDLAGLPLLATKLATKLLRSRLRGLPEYISGGKLLDVGCGSGNYLYSLRELGWDVYGMEIDEGAAGHARDRLGLKVFSGTLEEADFPDAFFDVVTMRQVLEHLSDPSSSLIEVHRVLKPGGRLMVEAPNIASLTAAMFKNWWFNLDAPRHLYAFRPRTLRAILEKSGFEQVKIEHLADTSGTTGSLQYLWNARAKDPEGNGIRHSKALHLALWPITFLLARLGRGEMIRAWSMKSEGSQLGR